jgi:hypothetical protein
VWVALNDPQPELPQVTLQSTPLLPESFATVAVIMAVALVVRVLGGVGVNVTEMGGAAVIVNVSESFLVISATDVAVSVGVLFGETGALAGGV